MFRFGCGHVTLDEAIHEASWGARLIYSEVVESRTGHTPVVWDRQTPDGDPETVQMLFPVIDRAIDEFRKVKYELSGSSRGRLCWRDGRALVVMSPQGSYGYLYVTAVLEREDHYGETHLADFEDGADIPLFGNWPPEVVEARLEAERKEAADRIVWAERDLKWAKDEVRYARTPRTAKMRQKNVDALEVHLAALRAKAGVA
jgi:hypothetical protein